jgi:hypothetical protein
MDIRGPEEDTLLMVNIFMVSTYTYLVGYGITTTYDGVRIQYQGRLSARGDDGSQLSVYGLHPASPVPPAPYCNAAQSHGAIFVPFADLQSYVDIVRNEKPVYGKLDPVMGMTLSTSLEPPGEEES